MVYHSRVPGGTPGVCVCVCVSMILPFLALSARYHNDSIGLSFNCALFGIDVICMVITLSRVCNIDCLNTV